VAEDSIKNIENANGGSAGDSITGDNNANALHGNGGNDSLKGGLGRDALDGGAGIDTADYSDKTTKVSVTLNGATAVTVSVNGVAEDTIKNVENLKGGSGGDALTGDALANAFVGNAGNDSLNGGLGKDVLTGNAGQDFFYFTTAPGSTNFDTITDFTHVDDTIRLGKSVFKSLGSTWSSGQFVADTSGHAVTGTTHHIIYDKSNGSLWYDDDAAGAHAALEFAVLSTKPADLNYTDFQLV
jgi:Ca2+-binding RTX toxin-like protein